MEGVDYAWARPNLDALWAAGKRFVVRYLAQLPNGKVLSASELAALHAKGFQVVLNWEQSSGDMLRGSTVGAAHAREALRQANALGAPADIPVYFSCDVNIGTASQLDGVRSYLNGAAGVLGRSRVGLYAEYSVIEALVPAVAPWGWQTYAWSGGRVSNKAHLYQYHNGVNVAGADCDLDRNLKPGFGGWVHETVKPPEPAPPEPLAAVVAPPMGDEMIYQVTGVPLGTKDVAGTTIPENGQCAATPAGAFSYTGSEFFSLPADAQKVRMTMPYARLVQLCAALAKATVDVPAIVAGVLGGLADDPASAVTQEDVERILAALEAVPAEVREEFTTDPLA